MRSVLHLVAYLFLVPLLGCETVPEELAWPTTEVDQGDEGELGGPVQHQPPLERSKLDVKPNDESTENSKEPQKQYAKLAELKDLATASKTIAKVIVFAPLLPFCYLSGLNTGGTQCSLNQ